VEFIMRGRAQACGVALVGYFIPLASPSTIGLVTLKKGSLEGSLVALWALLPVLLGWFVSDTEAYTANRLLTLVSSAALVIMVIGAQVLRVTISWQWALIAVMAASVVAIIGLNLLFPSGVKALVPIIMALMSGGDTEAANDIVEQQSLVLGLLTWGLVTTSVISLIVSRWWQSLVYNPGGFREEFQGLRMDAGLARVLLGIGALGVIFSPEYALWFRLLPIPLLVSGMALVHYSADALQLNASSVFIMYVGLFMFSPVFALLLVCLGFVDSHWDLRVRLADIVNRTPKE
jgi:hypothetical protein